MGAKAVWRGQLDGAIDSARLNTYQGYDLIRRNNPLCWDERGFLLITRYDDSEKVLRDSRLSNRPATFAAHHTRNRQRWVAPDIVANLQAFQDAPEHSQMRGAMNGAFRQTIAGCESPICSFVEELATGFTRRSSGDFVNDFASPFATEAACRILGVHSAEGPWLKLWSDDFLGLFHAVAGSVTLEHLNATPADFHALMVDQRRANRDGGLIAVIIVSADLTDARLDFIVNLILLAADAIENIWAGLANTVYVLLDNGTWLPEVLSNSNLGDSAIEECLRLESPGQYQGSITLENLDIRGRHARCMSVVVNFGAANRDPEVLPAPGVVCPNHKSPRHLAFGFGRHSCHGVALVRLELRLALRAFSQRPGFGALHLLALSEAIAPATGGSRGFLWNTKMQHDLLDS